MSAPSTLLSKSCILAGLLAAACLAPLAFSGNAPLPGNAKLEGMSLAQWSDLYYRNWYGGEGSNVVGHTVMLPLPGPTGEIDVDLQPGQSFVLPLWGVVGTSYDNTVTLPPDDIRDYPLSLFQTLDLTLTIDEEVVIPSTKGKKSNLMDFFAKGNFNPAFPLPADFSPYAAGIWFENIIIAHGPLSPGEHVIHLDAVNTQPQYDPFTGTNHLFYEYHNTWTITVGK